jgi:hypothetical protein
MNRAKQFLQNYTTAYARLFNKVNFILSNADL